MKKLTSVCITMLMIILVLSACSTNNNVANNSIVQKRKYTKGFYVQQSRTTVAKIENNEKIRITDAEIEQLTIAPDEPVSASTEAPVNSIQKPRSQAAAKIDKELNTIHNIFEVPIQLPKLKSKKAKEIASILSPKSENSLIEVLGFMFGIITLGLMIFLIGNFSWSLAIWSLISSIFGLIFSGTAFKKDETSVLAIIGLVLNSIPIVLLLIGIVLLIIFLSLFRPF
jgi:hypothetical protein